MNFRTEIGEIKGSFEITHADRIVMLGSCFSDTIGEQLDRDGFDVVHNPLGPLYNPASIATIFERGGHPYRTDELVEADGTFHCLDFASRYSDTDPDRLLELVNSHYTALWQAIERATVLIVTFGTARVYEYRHNRAIAGNCHRLPANQFDNYVLPLDSIVDSWLGLLPQGKKVIFTLSPIRYVADGLTANSLSKAVLRLAIESICQTEGCDYFPAFEILNDDLRDYRFYASDLKHPSEMAVDYVYERFAQTYFNPATTELARRHRKEWHRSLHDPNFKNKS